MMQLQTGRANERSHSTAMGNLAGKYLTFRLAREEYGLPILTVREIIGPMKITPVPRAPFEVRGVINLRGKIIPVVDLRRKFAMNDADLAEGSCIIVVQTSVDNELIDMGILVDSVSEVLDIAAQDIGPAPAFGKSVCTDFILGMAKAHGRVTVLLDIDELLTIGDIAAAKPGQHCHAET